MRTHMHREIERLKKMALHLGAMVEDAIARSVDALVRRDRPLAEAVMSADDTIDRFEVEIEEECLKILALYQPVAADLRFVVGVLKMNNDLERMGDLAAHIAHMSALLAAQEPVDLPLDFPAMANKAQSMVKRCLDALVNADVALARRVCGDDDEVDEMRRAFYEAIRDAIRGQPQHADALLTLLSVSRHLERLADMATNVAEDVIYMVTGTIARHRSQT
jgi:phosphate transport system protein